MKTRLYINIAILLFLTLKSWSVNDTTSNGIFNNLYLSVQQGKGMLVAHRASIAPLIETYTHPFYIEIAKKTYGKQAWQSLFHFPSLGVGYYHSDLSNNQILGKANAIYGFIDVPYFVEKQVVVNYKFGFGLANLSKKFDIDNNIYNIAIGSNLNFFVHFSFDLKVNLLNDKLFLKTGLGLTHMSNGKTQTPNLGLNFADLHITAGYFLGQQNEKINKPFPKRKKHTFVGIMAGGWKEFTEPNLGKFFAGNVTLEYEYSVMKKSSWGLGADYFYDGVAQKELSQEGDTKPSLHAGRVGVHAGFVFNYSKVGFIVQLGSYIKPYFSDDGYLYHRIGLRAKITPHLICNMTLKTHWARADIIELGFGYYFTR